MSRGHARAGGRARHGDSPRSRRARGRVPGRADLLRPDALQLRPRRRSAAAGPEVRRGLRRLRGDRGAVGLVRRTRAEARPGAPRRRSRRPRTDARALGVPGRAGRRARRRLLLPGSLAYHPTCHSLRLLRLGDPPVSLLRAVPGVELVELPDAEECCGFGGTFAVKNADVSTAMLDAKLDSVIASGRGRGVRVRCVVPAAHRRRAAPPRVTRACRRISPRCWPRDAGRARGARPSRSRRRRRRRSRTPAAGERPPRDDDDPRQAGAGVGEVPDWEELRDAGAAIKDHTLLSLDASPARARGSR